MAATVGVGRVGSGAKLWRGSHVVGAVVVAVDGAAVVVVGSVSAPSDLEHRAVRRRRARRQPDEHDRSGRDGRPPARAHDATFQFSSREVMGTGTAGSGSPAPR